MTWASRPPTMPTAGWYADPEQPWMWRWWDGGQWTAVRSPMGWAPAPKDPHSFSAWFEESTEAVKHVLRRVGLVVVVAYVACFTVIGLVVFGAFASSDGQEIRDILDVDGTFGTTGSRIEISDAEWDRAGDLLIDLLRTWAPALLVLALVLAVVTMWGLALTVRAAAHPTAPTGALMRQAVRRLPALAASSLALMCIFAGVMLLPLIPMVVALAADAGSAAIGFTAALGIPVVIVLACWIGGRLSLALVGAALEGNGLGIRRSWSLTRRHYWGVVARVIVASLIASVVTMPLGFVSGFASAISVWFLVMFTLVVQGISAAASVLVTTPAQVVLWQHLSAEAEQTT